VRGTTDRRSGPLTIKVPSGELTLLSGDVDAIVSAGTRWADSLQAATPAEDRPSRLVSSQTAVAGVNRLMESMLGAPGGLAAPPLELDSQQAALLRRVLADMAGYQRQPLSAPLCELQNAIEAR
jgi:hypothetical protein